MADAYILTDSEDGAPEGCGECTPTQACEDPQAGCYVHIPGYTDTPLYSGAHGDYTVHAVGTCDACTPAYRPCADPDCDRTACINTHPPCTCGVYGPHRPGADCER